MRSVGVLYAAPRGRDGSMADTEEAMEVEEAQPAPSEVAKEAGSSKAPAKRFEIKKWNAVAMWSWAICTDTCAICRNNLYEPSIEYQANPTGTRSPLYGLGLLQRPLCCMCLLSIVAAVVTHMSAL